MTSNADIARSMADTMTHSAVPLYGKRLRLPDRGAIIGIIKELRRRRTGPPAAPGRSGR